MLFFWNYLGHYRYFIVLYYDIEYVFNVRVCVIIQNLMSFTTPFNITPSGRGLFPPAPAVLSLASSFATTPRSPPTPLTHPYDSSQPTLPLGPPRGRMGLKAPCAGGAYAVMHINIYGAFFNGVFSACESKAQQSITHAYTSVVETCMHKCAFPEKCLTKCSKIFQNNVT
jgi:hypothetical protein